MGWDQKDATGESLWEGDHVKVFRNFSGDVDCTDFVGRVGVVGSVEFPYYTGKLHVGVCFTDESGLWVHHMSVMKV